MPFDTAWSVVVAGYWNRAILTPAGIGKFVLGAEGVPVEVAIAIDSLAPPRVTYGGITVLTGGNHLIIQPSVASFDELEKCKVAAARAVGYLPKTPMSAAGINVRYVADGVSDTLRDIVEHSSDDTLTDNEFQILDRSHRRSVNWGAGKINLQVDRNAEGQYLALLNFDLQSTDPDAIKAWLETPIASIKQVTDRLMANYFGVEDFYEHI